jgi:tetratricopeptide (TPR) repeat protein
MASASIYQKIVERLDKLRSLYKLIAEPSVKLSHIGDPNSVVSLDSIVKFEKEHHVKLPDEYAKFLLEVFNGGIGPGKVLYTLHDSYYTYWMDLGPLQAQCNLNQEVYARKLDELLARNNGNSAQDNLSDVPQTNFEINGQKYYIMNISISNKSIESLLNSETRMHLSALFDKKEARQGCLLVGYGGDSIFYFLVVTGSERGKVWKCDNGCYIPTKLNFIEWFEDWLNRTLILFRDQANFQKQQIVELQEKASSSPDAAFNAGIWFFKHGQYEKAKKFFSECLKMSAEKGLFNLLFKTCQQLCQTLLKLKDLESCLRTAQVGEKQVGRVFASEVKMDLDAAEEFRLSFKYYQGAVYYKRQMFKEALQAFSAIISNDYAKTRYYYGKILLAEGQLENAVNYFHRTDHTSTSLYLELANVEFERKHYDKALQYSMAGIFSRIGKQSRKQDLAAVFSKAFFELWTKETSNTAELVNCLENVEDVLPNDPNIQQLIAQIEEN